MALFEIKNLTFTYPGQTRPALKNINLEINPGQIVLILGDSGSGKTTLLNHLKSAMTPHGTKEGEILYRGQPLEQTDFKTQSTDIGYVVQNPSRQTVTDTVKAELSFAMENVGMPAESITVRAAETACFFGIDRWYDLPVKNLSGGQKQLLNLACVSALCPRVIVLDEPISQLDPIAAEEFLNGLWRLNRELGITVIITEHRCGEIFPHRDSIVYMEKGQIAFCAHKGDKYENLPEGFKKFLPSPAKIFQRLGKTQLPLSVNRGRQALKKIVGEKSPLCTEQKQQSHQKPVVGRQIKNLYFRYAKNGQDILKNTCFTAYKGKIHSVVGANGSGKSTFLKAVCGICRRYGGKVDLQGAKCVYLPQEPILMFSKESLLEDLKDVCPDQKTVEETARLCRIEDILHMHPYDISAGQCQKAALAKAILTGAEILLLDEFTKGMDAGAKEFSANILKNLCRQGKTVISVSHDIEFCRQYSDFVSMFFDGQIICTDTPKVFFTGNNFYTTAAARMAKGILPGCISEGEIIEICKENLLQKD